MGSIRAVRQEKLLISFETIEDVDRNVRLEEELISEFGPADHRLSVIPTDGTIHRVLLSFDRLVDSASLPKLREVYKSIERKYSVTLHVAILDNRRVAAEAGKNEDIAQFKADGLHYFAPTPSFFQSADVRDFVLSMRKSFRARLRTLCLLQR